MEKVVREQGLALQQHFSCRSSTFSENSNCPARNLKLGHLDSSGILQVIAHHIKNFLGKMWSCDPSCKGTKYGKMGDGAMTLLQVLDLPGPAYEDYSTKPRNQITGHRPKQPDD